MPPSRLDSLYRRLLITRFFEKGWGKPANLQRLFEFRKFISRREACYNLVPKDYPIEITKQERQSDCTVLEGHFTTPLEFHLPGLVPKEAQQAHFQIVLPNEWKRGNHKPVCVHLAGTGDHYFWRRRNLIVKPLLKEANLGAIILENPFYGLRKPQDQIRSNLHNVSDIFVMGGCLILECLVLFHWCERNGYGPLGVTGLSMGGHMASLAASNWPKPIVLVPCLSWSTAATVFTTGVMSQSINWDMLETQYFSDGNYRERLSKMVTIIDDAFMAGQNFVKDFSQSMMELKRDINDTQDDKSNDIQTVKINVDSKIIALDKNNSLGLNESLHEKLMSDNRFELADREINELNLKIKGVYFKMREEKQKQEFVQNPTKMSTKTLLDGRNINLMVNCNRTKLPPKIPEELSTMTKLMRYILPFSNSNADKIKITKTNWWEREALQFMRGVMDECTHLKNFSVPYDTSLIIAVCAKDDAYVPRDGCTSLEDIWPGVEVRYLDAGHVSAYVLHQKLFRSSIIEAFERAMRKADECSGYLTNSEYVAPTCTYRELQQKYEKAINS